MKKIITRFPPSPTGVFHVGSARTALFNFLYAKQNEGEFKLRFEDTDKKRSAREYEENILIGLEWLGIHYDGEILRQSERGEVYQKYLKQMLEDGSAYEGEQSLSAHTGEGEEGNVIRFRNPNKTITFQDEIRGDVTFDTTELGDFVIARNINDPLYHLTVVIDDNEMEVSHIIRGEDHISNTSRQILIQEAIGANRPVYAHIPLILAPDRSKMSKRHGAVSISEYKDMGFLPEAMLNYLALLGWNPGGDREIFNLEELVKEFSIERIQKGGAIFNIEKLRSINSHYIKELSDQDFIEKILDGIPTRFREFENYSEEKFNKILRFLQERVSDGVEAKEMIDEGEFDYFFQYPEYDSSELVWKDATSEATIKHLKFVVSKLDTLQPDDFVASHIKSSVWDYATEEGRGEVLWPMRYALSGKKKSPDPFEIAEILGKDETIERLNNSIEILKKES